jgi:hypothetical protein
MSPTEALQILRSLASGDMLSRDYRDAARMGVDALESSLKLKSLVRQTSAVPKDFNGMKTFIIELTKDMIKSEVPHEELEARSYELLLSICNDYQNTR